MESAVTIFYQIVKMFVMMAAGYILAKKKIINGETTARLSDILLMVATPCTLITSFNQPYSLAKLQGLGLAFVLSLLVYAVNIAVSAVLLKKEQRIEKFSVVFSNAGFLGIPLVTGLLGLDAVFYLAPFIVCFYLYAWTYGVGMMSGSRDNVTLKKIAFNPCIWSVAVGILVFLMPVKPFAPVMEAVSALGSMNTPLAMLILGAYLAKSPLLEMFANRKAYLVSIYRLIVIPFILVLLMKLLPASVQEIRLIILIAASAPVAVLGPVFAQMYDLDFSHGAQIVSLSTILSLVSMPVILMIAEMLW